MTRIQKKFAQLKKQKRKALVLFITAGDPSFKRNEELIPAFERAGADIIELGVPFSDPLADGPVIQASSKRSLEKGTNLAKILGLVKKVRKTSEVPLVLMSYLNPILHYGVQRFSQDAKKAGVDGVIVPDMPPDEGKEFSQAMKHVGIDLIYLVAPTSTAERRRKVVSASSGFVYYVSITGVTGVRTELPKEIYQNIQAVKKAGKLPVCVGFGVSTPAQAESIAKVADGVIIGSAIVRALEANKSMSAEAFSKKFVRPFAAALQKGR